MTIPSGTSAGTYQVTWNGHGDALALWKVNADGTLTLANSYAYDTWGKPTTTLAGSFADLGFRYLYVGGSDVEWDNGLSVGLLYMHARHYAPWLGRFVQPDPADAETNLLAYAHNNPITRIDPSGQFCMVPVFGQIVCVRVAIWVGVAIYSFVAGQVAAHYVRTNQGPWSRSGTSTVSNQFNPEQRHWWQQELNRHARDERLDTNLNPRRPPIGPSRTWCSRSGRNMVRCVVVAAGVVVAIFYMIVNADDIDRRAGPHGFE